MVCSIWLSERRTTRANEDMQNVHADAIRAAAREPLIA